MPRTCAVRGCQTNRHCYEPGVRFFRIPQDDEDMRGRWVALLGRPAGWKATAIHAVCERHFEPAEVARGERGLAATVVPRIGLPPPEEEEGTSSSEEEEEKELKIKEETVQKVEKRKKTSAQTRERVKRTKTEARQPELVLVPEVPEPAAAYDAQCRFCSQELKPTVVGWDIDEIRATETVRDSIWKQCLVEDLEDLLEYLYPRRICDSCWQSMQSFERFVEDCHQKQKTLKSRLETVIKDEPESFGSESESEAEEHKPLEEKLPLEEQLPLEVVSTTSRSKKQRCSQKLPPKEENVKSMDAEFLDKLKGLTVDEMIEYLDKVPPGDRTFSSLAPDAECYDCGQMFPNRNKMRTHRFTCTAIGTPDSLRNKAYTCEICSKACNSRLGYRMHLYKIHYSQPDLPEDQWPEELKRMQGKKQLPCPLCSDRFHQMHHLKYHLKTHKKRTEPHNGRKQTADAPRDKTCKVCGKTFANPFYMQTHMKFHNREKNFECDQCHKRFYIKHDLKDHIATRHGQHKFLCGTCGKTFGTRRGLQRHSLVHDESGTRETYQCEYCQKSFHHPCQLKYHVMKHTGERQYQCEVCGAGYRFRYMLTYHKRDKHGIAVDHEKLAYKHLPLTPLIDDKNEDDDDESAMEVEALDEAGDVRQPVDDC